MARLKSLPKDIFSLPLVANIWNVWKRLLGQTIQLSFPEYSRDEEKKSDCTGDGWEEKRQRQGQRVCHQHQWLGPEVQVPAGVNDIKRFFFFINVNAEDKQERLSLVSF